VISLPNSKKRKGITLNPNSRRWGFAVGRAGGFRTPDRSPAQLGPRSNNVSGKYDFNARIGSLIK
jgi:hypothetical protein